MATCKTDTKVMILGASLDLVKKISLNKFTTGKETSDTTAFTQCFSLLIPSAFKSAMQHDSLRCI